MLVSSKLIVDLMLAFADSGISLALAEDNKTLLVNKIPFVSSKWEHDELANYHRLTAELQQSILDDIKNEIVALSHISLPVAASAKKEEVIIDSHEDDAEIDKAFADAGVVVNGDGEVVESKLPDNSVDAEPVVDSAASSSEASAANEAPPEASQPSVAPSAPAKRRSR